MSHPTHPVLPIVAVILAGGSGTRFWPLSHAERPKQFLTLFGGRSMLQHTFDRVAPLCGAQQVIVLTGSAFVDTVAEQLPELAPAQIVGEPVARDTAAAVALAAKVVRDRFGECLMIVLPADHLVEPAHSFRETMLRAAVAAEQSFALVTLGIEPAFASSDYGYLECQPQEYFPGVFHLAAFCEKPDRATAEAFVASGRHCWNSGMFLWRVSAIWAEIERLLPEHAAALKALPSSVNPGWEAHLSEALSPLPKLSIDYGVMERANAVLMVRADFTWSDIGGWMALEEHYPTEDHGNRARGAVRVRDAQGNFVFCENPDETVVLVGVHDLVVVRAGGRTLVMHKDHAGKLKGIVQELEELAR